MVQQIKFKFWGILFLSYSILSTSIARAEPIQDLARITQNIATQAQNIRSGDPVNDLIQAIVLIANVLNTTAPQIEKFAKDTENFYPKAEGFINNFQELLDNYGESWISFSQSFSQIASIIVQHSPEMIPKINAALDSITNINQVVNQNSEPFMRGFGSASSAITGIASTKLLMGVLAGAIAVAWCLKYEELGKYVFTFDPNRNVFYQGANYCGKCFSSSWNWLSIRKSRSCSNRPEDRESGGTDLELGLPIQTSDEQITLTRRSSSRSVGQYKSPHLLPDRPSS
jgi:hypothetical protein